MRCGNIEAIPFAAKEFTKVCSVNTIYFWQDPAVALSECRRVLKAGGQTLLCFNSLEDLEKWPLHKHGFRLYEVEEVETLLRTSSFENIQVVSAGDADQGLFYCVSGTAV